MICGVDEAGRGPVMGPLVVCGVAVDSEDALKELKVRDSKKLSSKRREDLDRKIRKVARVHLEIITAEEIDTFREHQSLNVIEAVAFSRVIKALSPNIVYVDAADSNADNFRFEILKRIGQDIEVVSRHKADDIYPVVSAASIVAKVRRDAEVQRIEQELGASMGSGYPSDPRTVWFLEKWIKEHGHLPPHIRKSWKTSQNLLKNHGPGAVTLDDFKG